MQYDFVEVVEHLDQVQEQMEKFLEEDDYEQALALYQSLIKYKGIIEDLNAKGEKATAEEIEFRDKYVACLVDIGEATLEYLQDQKEQTREELIKLGKGRKGKSEYQTIRRTPSK